MSETSEQPQASETTRARAAAPHVRIPETLPLIPGGSTVMYPQQLMPVLATEQRDIQAISEASTSDAKMVGVFAQKVNDNGSHSQNGEGPGRYGTRHLAGRQPDQAAVSGPAGPMPARPGRPHERASR